MSRRPRGIREDAAFHMAEPLTRGPVQGLSGTELVSPGTGMIGDPWHAARSGGHNRPVTWISPEPPDDPPSPDTGDIRPILQGYLDNQRLTLLRICAGLTMLTVWPASCNAKATPRL